MSAPTIPFSFNNHSVRIIMLDGEPWFVAKDVMAALDYAENYKTTRATAHIPSEWRGVHPMNTPSKNQHGSYGTVEQNMLCLSEPGLYFFLGRSDKPKALPFQKWLAGEVLPSIRKTGSYSTAPAAIEEKPNPSIDVKTLLLEGHCDPFLPLPASVQKAIDKKAWAMAHEAYELCREHLNRRVAYYASVGYPRRLDRQRALSVIKRGNLNYALAHAYWHELSYIAHEINMVSRQSVKFKDKMEKMMTRFEEGKF